DIVIDPLANDFAQASTNIAFSTLDSVSNNMRALAANEMESVLPTSGVTGATVNYSLNTTVALANNQSSNTIRLENGGGLSLSPDTTSGRFGAAGTLVTETLTTSGLLALSGNTGVNVGALLSPGTQYLIWTEGATTTLSLTGYLTSAQALVKAGNGELILNTGG